MLVHERKKAPDPQNHGAFILTNSIKGEISKWKIIQSRKNIKNSSWTNHGMSKYIL
jgi:hypothetical protein